MFYRPDQDAAAAGAYARRLLPQRQDRQADQDGPGHAGQQPPSSYQDTVSEEHAVSKEYTRLAAEWPLRGAS